MPGTIEGIMGPESGRQKSCSGGDLGKEVTAMLQHSELGAGAGMLLKAVGAQGCC